MARWVLLWAMAWLWLLAWPVNVQAQSPANEVVDLGLEQADDGLYLNAALQLALPALAEDALYKGIPVFLWRKPRCCVSAGTGQTAKWPQPRAICG